MAQKKTSRKNNTSRRANAKTTRGGTSRSSRSKSSRGRAKRPAFSLNMKQKALIVGITLIFITAIIVLSLLSPNQGQLTATLSTFMWQLFGWGGIFVPVALGATGFYLVLWGMEQHPALPVYRLVGVALLFLTFEVFAAMTVVRVDTELADVWAAAQAARGGGYLGAILTTLFRHAVGTVGTVLVFLVAGFIAAVLALGVTRQDFGLFLNRIYALLRPEPTVVVSGEREIPINPRRASPPPVERPAASIEAVRPEVSTAKPTADKSVPEPNRPRPEPVVSGTRRRGQPKPEPAVEVAAVEPALLSEAGRNESYSWELPPLQEILESGTDQDVNSASIREQVEVIEHTLESFGAPATVVEINQGPTITQFGVEPRFLEQRSGKRTKVKVGKIAGLADDLALALAARSIRIQAPVPGKGYVGIEVPNSSKAMVSLRDIMESHEFQRIKSPLRIGLGQNVAGQPIAADLAAMPHLLIAGTTGSGKSVCVNGIIACLLLQNTPEDLKLVLVDPKRVELTGYNGVPHLAAPVIVDMERVIGTLQWAMREMDNRYKMFAEVGARNITDYNKKIADDPKRDRLPYIVIVIDELADLMMMSPEDTERGITRLAQMARATGMHMVIATQRPSVDVVTGIIKANFPARVAFAVASSTDSRVILDTTGAERLLGQGDMLFQSPDAAAPVRMQGCYVSDQELRELIEYWQGARRINLIRPDARPEAAIEDAKDAAAPTDGKEAAPPPPRQQPLWEELQAMEAEPDDQYDDELMPEAIELVRKLNKASTSLLQRRFRIGYTRAARLIDAMEDHGIIGPPTGTSKAREVLPSPDGSAVAEENGAADEADAA